jgi:hypothetical protein
MARARRATVISRTATDGRVLGRLKPDPVPVIHPVPEHAARGALAEVYARTRKGLGVPWMGVVAMALARFPRFYDRLWSALAPLAATQAFATACDTLRSASESEAAALSAPDRVAYLVNLGYGDRELEEIRACHEVFSTGNMPYLLMATIARLLLEGHDWAGGESLEPRCSTPESGPKPTLIEPHHADPTVAAVYADIRETLGLPFVNTDYRAFARWPSYFVPAWADLKAAISGPDHAGAVNRVHHMAVEVALGLPNPAGLSSDALKKAAAEDGPIDDILSVVRLFQWLLPGLVVNVAFLRAQLGAVASDGDDRSRCARSA